jgi:hypothetical protein
MNDVLSDQLAQLNLAPGQCRRVQVNGYEVEIRRLGSAPSAFDDSVMLQPWVWFPDSTMSRTLPVKQSRLPLPDQPVIPTDHEDAA